ncbi:MAG: UDP-galactopyranose mutase [Gaiellaceae bacterium]|jgi:UDP-galactopyranose mutase
MLQREFDVVCLSHLRWDWVWQRPQHLLSRCARHRRVFYVEEAIFDGDTRIEVDETESGVFVVKPHVPTGLSLRELDAVQQTLLDELFVQFEIDAYLLWVYAPMAVTYAEHLTPIATVYDCMDELSLFSGAPPELRKREDQLFDAADLVFTGGASLYEAKRERHHSVHCFPSSVDADHFAQARAVATDPADQAAVPRPRIGFVGVIDERIDLGLILELADARPDWQIVLAGPVVKIDPATLPQRPNIHYLGAKRYEDLPPYMAGWDVAWMPFAKNDATRFISPTKTLEYLAADRPVVSTSIRDVVRPYGDAGLVAIADDVEATIDAVERALARNADEHRARVEALLEETSWDRTWSSMQALIDDVLGGGRKLRRNAAKPFDYLVVGAGFAGSVLAERLATQSGKRVLVVDRRNHVGGNAYDHYDAAGVLVHKYGPHIFHTNSREVFDYLSQFTDWRRYEHRVRASVDGRLVPLPINLDTINELYGTNLDARGLEEFFASVAEPVERIRTSEDVVVSKVGRELYEKFFRNYTRKQWDLDPSELDASVTARVPTRLNRDDRYFADTYQAMPLHGYTRMFERMLDHPNIKVLLQTDYREIDGAFPFDQMVYTGPVDEFFDLRYGKLPYRSLEFKFETLDYEWFQPAPVVNFPNEHLYTRCTEFKYLTGQEHAKTTVVYEFPRAEGDPYYPVPRPENGELYKRYKALADATRGVHFVGRLATYKYYNMDQVVAQALAMFRRIETGAPTGAIAEAPAERNGSRVRVVRGRPGR